MEGCFKTFTQFQVNGVNEIDYPRASIKTLKPSEQSIVVNTLKRKVSKIPFYTEL